VDRDAIFLLDRGLPAAEPMDDKEFAMIKRAVRVLTRLQPPIYEID
jgi:hypothetical protein